MQEEIEKIKERIENLKTQQDRNFSHLESEDGTTRRLLEHTNNHFFKIEKDLREAIFGNGKVGLVSEIHILKEHNRQLRLFVDELKLEVKSLNEYKTEQKGSIRVALWFLGIGVTILVGIIIALVTK